MLQKYIFYFCTVKSEEKISSSSPFFL